MQGASFKSGVVREGDVKQSVRWVVKWVVIRDVNAAALATGGRVGEKGAVGNHHKLLFIVINRPAFSLARGDIAVKGGALHGQLIDGIDRPTPAVGIKIAGNVAVKGGILDRRLGAKSKIERAATAVGSKIAVEGHPFEG